MKNFYTHDQIKHRWPHIVPTVEEPGHRHFHFRPSRPANLLVTLDRQTKEVNVSAGTIGPLTWDPYTIVIHCAKSSLDSVHNIQEIGAECVVGLPGKDIIYETWITALSIPRGVNEAEVARLTLFPSRLVTPPSIAECPINFECVIEYYREQHSHYIAFLRVLGATVDEEVLTMNQEEAMYQYPTWEVEDVDNEWGGKVERLGILGDFLPTPRVRAARGWGTSFTNWLEDLYTAGELSSEEYETARGWMGAWDRMSGQPQSDWQPQSDALEPQALPSERDHLKKKITRLFELIAWEEFDTLHELLAQRDPMF